MTKSFPTNWIVHLREFVEWLVQSPHIVHDLFCWRHLSLHSLSFRSLSNFNWSSANVHFHSLIANCFQFSKLNFLQSDGVFVKWIIWSDSHGVRAVLDVDSPAVLRQNDHVSVDGVHRGGCSDSIDAPSTERLQKRIVSWENIYEHRLGMWNKHIWNVHDCNLIISINNLCPFWWLWWMVDC